MRSEKRQRTVLIGVRMTPAEKHDIETVAKMLDISIAELVRRRCCHV